MSGEQLDCEVQKYDTLNVNAGVWSYGFEQWIVTRQITKYKVHIVPENEFVYLCPASVNFR